MTETTPSVKDFVNASKAKAPRTTKKSTAHDADFGTSKTTNKAAIADAISSIAAKSVADAQAFAQETYARGFLAELENQKQSFEALTFTAIQRSAKQKTAHILKGETQLQLAGSADTQPQIFACEDWLGDDDDA